MSVPRQFWLCTGGGLAVSLKTLKQERNLLKISGRCLQVATNPTHYGNPSTGCESDEQAVRVQGLSGDFCSPKCSSSGSCPSDVPSGDTASPQCALRTTTGDKYCALICQSDSECGGSTARKHGRKACVAHLSCMWSVPLDAKQGLVASLLASCDTCPMVAAF